MLLFWLSRFIPIIMGDINFSMQPWGQESSSQQTFLRAKCKLQESFKGITHQTPDVFTLLLRTCNPSLRKQLCAHCMIEYTLLILLTTRLQMCDRYRMA